MRRMTIFRVMPDGNVIAVFTDSLWGNGEGWTVSGRLQGGLNVAALVDTYPPATAKQYRKVKRDMEHAGIEVVVDTYHQGR